MTNVSLRGVRAVICGAGVAGPALAYWLAQYGARTTVVEIAPALRTSGFAVDFRGPTHLRLLARMGVLDELRELQTHGNEWCCVDEHGKEIFRLPAEFTGGDIEVYRRDLSRVLYHRSAERAEYLFGETITGLTQTESGVHVEFASGSARTFDIVIGADGMRSVVRLLAFGPEPDYLRHLGFYLAGWQLPNEREVDSAFRHYNLPERMAGVSADLRDPSRANAMVVFTAPPPDGDWPDLDQQRRLITEKYLGMRWHVPWLLDGLANAAELYFDGISRVRMPNWHTGRVALLGDAAWGVTLGGMGVGTGVVGAYVLAGELARAGGDHRVGLAAYEQRMRGYAARWQRGANPGQFLAPPTATRLWARNAMLGNRLVQKLVLRGTASLATEADLPEYASPASIAR